MGIKNILKNVYTFFNKSSKIQKVFYVLAVVFIITMFVDNNNNNNASREGFDADAEGTSKFELIEGPAIYDKFYANIYDELVFCKMKDDFEIGEIINTTRPTSESRILDVGSGTGHHVSNFKANGFTAVGVDISPAMANKAKENYPELEFKLGDVLETMLYPANSFTHITCLYFTLYYIKNKRQFFENCIHWLRPGGYLAVHLVDRDKFDPILPAGDPFGIISPQKYAKKRITSTIVKFKGFDYKSEFEVEDTNTAENADDANASLQETFKNKMDGKVRKNKHKFYMATQTAILAIAKSVGFIMTAKIDMLKCQYTHQYIYILQKPT
jgi:SAM-dependent methyltransferase